MGKENGDLHNGKVTCFGGMYQMAKAWTGARDHELVRRGGLSSDMLENVRFLSHYSHAAAEFDPEELSCLIDNTALAFRRVNIQDQLNNKKHKPEHSLQIAGIAEEIDIKDLLEMGIMVDQAKLMEEELQAARSSVAVDPLQQPWLFR